MKTYDMKNVGIYKLISPSGKVYIGQSKNLKVRFQRYKRLHCKGQVHLYHALQKYSFDSFKVITLVSFSEYSPFIQTILDKLEIHFIKLFKSNLNGYNLQGGGKNGSHAKETIQKMKHAQKGRIFSELHKKHISDSKIGIKHNLTIEKMLQVKILRSKPVKQYSLEMHFLKQWNTITEACQFLGVNGRKTIAACARKNCPTAYGFIWQY